MLRFRDVTSTRGVQCMSFITVIDEQAEILTQSICTPVRKHQGVNSRLVEMGETATFYKPKDKMIYSTFSYVQKMETGIIRGRIFIYLYLNHLLFGTALLTQCFC